ncbi:type II toxin-antitoxin system PemK/MazF family toxin [Deinococcus taeanensis]|uniref:type II toxin-antitoxin system PemK/MazF family toxin n=1 Tax=Deinococcus taeanensis TaxID=2737050 RepID=UPI0032E7F8AE
MYLAGPAPAWSSEADQRRPVVIVSTDSLNRTIDGLGARAVTVVPVTSTVTRIHDFQVLLPADLTGPDQDGKAQVSSAQSASAAWAARPSGGSRQT